MHSPTSAAVGPRPADVERWLVELGIEPLERADREGVAAWDVVLDGRRRHDLRVTLILDPSLGLICWAHYAPPISDLFRKSYRRLLRWNDELPFVKFAISDDERPVLSTELGSVVVDRDVLGLALARLLAVSDRLLEESAQWLWLGGKRPPDYDSRPARDAALLDRYADRLGELGT
ncbi:MAG TPA: YbjN domain-containing protein [Vitreimonas sp.]|nr:YbjN domain-containing protein [Vitreimonas sp.]